MYVFWRAICDGDASPRADFSIKFLCSVPHDGRMERLKRDVEK
jgi:hypothetical protein